MITTLSDFEDETAWERTVLAMGVPVMPLAASDTELDLRTNRAFIGVSEAVSDSAVEEFRNSLLPLLFGAAWKTLDLGIELALAMAGLVPKNGQRWLIAEKSQKAELGVLPAFASAPDSWRALCCLYAGTEEIRNALVHRRVQVEASTRELIAFDKQENKLLPLSYAEQIAFCRLAQRLAQAIVEGSLQSRVEADLRSQLAALHKHHGVNIAAQVDSRPPIRVIIDIPQSRQLDTKALLTQIQRNFRAQYIDLELHLLDGRVLVGELDAAPKEVVTIDPAALPPWLQFA
jgi:hypothetical protein